MPNTSTVMAVIARLKSQPKVTNLLADGVNGIVSSGRVTQSSNRPIIVVMDAGESGSARTRPWIDNRIKVRAYGTGSSANTADYYSLHAILKECIEALDRAPLTTTESYAALFSLYYDSFMSSDLWDYNLQLPYKECRFCAYGVRPRYDAPSS